MCRNHFTERRNVTKKVHQIIDWSARSMLRHVYYVEPISSQLSISVWIRTSYRANVYTCAVLRRLPKNGPVFSKSD